MTLAELIAQMKVLDMHHPIPRLANPHSYRGYYDHLAFEVDSSTTMDAGVFLDICEKLLGSVLRGYKGGEYIVTEKTPVWIAEYGSTGRPLLGITLEEGLQLGEDDC